MKKLVITSDIKIYFLITLKLSGVDVYLQSLHTKSPVLPFAAEPPILYAFGTISCHSSLFILLEPHLGHLFIVKSNYLVNL